MPFLGPEDFITRSTSILDREEDVDIDELFADLTPFDWPVDPIERLSEGVELPTIEIGKSVQPERTVAETTDLMTSTPKERRQAKETVQETTPGSSANFQAAQAATMPGKMKANSLVMKALSKKDANYVWGAESAAEGGFDCSGLIVAALRESGFPNFPRMTSGTLIEHAKPISVKKAMNTRGALLWAEGHIAISLGNGKTIEAMNRDNDILVADAAGRFTKGGLLPELDYSGGGGRRKPNTKVLKTIKTQPARRDKMQPGDLEDLRDPLVVLPMSLGTIISEALPETRRPRRAYEQQQLMDESDPRLLAKEMAARLGWTGEQWKALDLIVDGGTWNGRDIIAESHWDPKADNPESTALGIGQRLVSEHPFSSKQEEERYRNSAKVQIRWMLSYILGRYKNPMNALRFKAVHGWY